MRFTGSAGEIPCMPMSYFVTGATGFIGRNLVEKLLQREGTVYALVRAGSRGRLEELRTGLGADGARIVPITGDLSQPGLGVSEEDLVAMRGEIGHFFHLAAIYDLTADAEAQEIANVEGTRHAIELAGALEAGCFHQVSSIAAAGLYKGVWTEEMFDEAEKLDNNPYFRTKHESERLVRDECQRPWRVYRPGIVVGDSRSGEIDKIDGPYYFFKSLQRRRRLAPFWVPGLGGEGGEVNNLPRRSVPAAGAFLVAGAGDRRRRDQHRPGRLRRCGDRPHRPQTAAERARLPPHRPQPAHRGRGDQPLRPGRRRAADGGAARHRRDRAGDRGGADGAEAVPARQTRGEGGAGPARPAGGDAHLRRLPDQLRLDQDAESAERLGDRGAAAGVLRGADLGLLGAQPRPRPLQGPLALGGGAGESGADHRGVFRDRQGDRGQGRRRGGDGPAGRPLARQARGDQGRDRRRGRQRPHPPVRPLRDRGHRADGRGG